MSNEQTESETVEETTETTTTTTTEPEGFGDKDPADAVDEEADT